MRILILRTSDNWWNRYKAEWIGDYLFFNILQNALYEYICSVTRGYLEHEENATNNLLYFTALRKILFSEVTFTRSRAQPLILDQCFIKSTYLQQFFLHLGAQHGVSWAIPPNSAVLQIFILSVTEYAINMHSLYAAKQESSSYS